MWLLHAEIFTTKTQRHKAKDGMGKIKKTLPAISPFSLGCFGAVEVLVWQQSCWILSVEIFELWQAWR
jgi:hypothetical protein